MSVLTRLSAAAGIVLFAAVSLPLSAQMPGPLERDSVFRAAPSILAKAPPVWRGLIEKSQGIDRFNALRVTRDLAGTTWSGGTLAVYTVPALSTIPRLPAQCPVDGTLFAPVDIAAARGEFEPASFVVYSAVPHEKVQLAVSDLKTADGKILPASKIDLKVVKVWYQNANGWYSYFGDFTHKLVPELLLNDENLIRVDTEKQENYLRVDYESGTRYIWISAPEQIDPGFDSDKEPVADAASIQPVRLEAGKFKQFFVTVEVGADTAPGLYTGSVKIGDLATVPVRLRVLPFALPDPKTYYNTEADFYTMLYCVPGWNQYEGRNGRDRARSNAKALLRLQNQRKHNVTSPLYMGMWNGYNGFDDMVNSIELAKKAGMKMKPFFEAFGCHATNSTEKYFALKHRAELAKKELGRLLGHTELWPAGGEEPGFGGIVGARKDWKIVHDLGMHVMCNGGDRRHFSGYNDEFRVGGGFATKGEADFMHRIQGRIGNYAGPHTGPENPDYMRRQHGMNLYKKDYDMMYNYGYHEGGWNDFHPNTYRNMNLIQYTRDGIIDSLAWEGIREGIDDIRYATLMLTLAKEAAASGKTDSVYAGRKAMQFLALLNEDEADLPAARLEMIRHILTLRNLLGKD